MKVYELKNGERMTNALLDIPFNSNCLDLKEVDECFPDFIKIGYTDKELLKALPYYPIENISFTVETMGMNPEIKLDVFYAEDHFGEKEMETLEVTFTQAEKDALQNMMLKVICDLLYGVPMFLKDRLKPSEKDIIEVREYLNDLNIDAIIPAFDTVGELWQWRSKQYRKRIAV